MHFSVELVKDNRRSMTMSQASVNVYPTLVRLARGGVKKYAVKTQLIRIDLM